MAGRSTDPLTSLSFLVEIEGITTALFSSVDGLESTSEIVVYRIGGDPLERKLPGRTSYANLVLRRLYGGDDALLQWRRQVEDGQIQRRALSIILSGPDGAERVRFNAFEAWPCRWRLAGLDAASSAGLMEEIELAIERLERA